MARYVIDAPTLVHIVDAGLPVDPGHQLVAPNSIRSEALELLLRDVRWPSSRTWVPQLTPARPASLAARGTRDSRFLQGLFHAISPH